VPPPDRTNPKPPQPLDHKTGAGQSQRWYQFGGQTFASRTTAGLKILTTDNHGTGQVQIDAATAAVVKRRFDPFGAQRGGGTTPTNWTGDHGFLDKPTDTNSGLTQIGARYYDPTLGTFISVDPLLDPNDTHQANAYNYVANNPLTFSDPTGLRCDPTPSQPCPTTPPAGDGAGGGGGGDGGGDPGGGSSAGGSVGAPDQNSNGTSESSRRIVLPPAIRKTLSTQEIQTLIGNYVQESVIYGVNTRYVRPRVTAIENLKRSNPSFREVGRLQAEDLGYGNGRGGYKIALIRSAKLARIAAKSLGVIGAGVTAVETGVDEWKEQADQPTSERVTRTVIKSSLATAGGVALGAAGATACSALGPGAIACAAAGGYVGVKAGELAGDAINTLVYDSGIDWSPWN
jgi:RHS repeat-associated protein